MCIIVCVKVCVYCVCWVWDEWACMGRTMLVAAVCAAQLLQAPLMLSHVLTPLLLFNSDLWNNSKRKLYIYIKTRYSWKICLLIKKSYKETKAILFMKYTYKMFIFSSFRGFYQNVNCSVCIYVIKWVLIINTKNQIYIYIYIPFQQTAVANICKELSLFFWTSHPKV